MRAARRFGPYVWKYRGRAAAVLVLGLLTGFLIKAPLLLLSPFINKVIGLGPANTPPDAVKKALAKVDDVVEWVRTLLISGFPALDGSVDGRQISLIFAIALSVLVVALIGALVQLIFVQMSRALSMRVLADLREDLADHVLKLGMRYHTASKKGDLLSRATTDVNVLLVALSLLFDDLILEPAQLLGTFALTIISNPEATLLTIIIIPSVAVPLVVFGKKVRKGTRKSLVALGESTEAMAQMFAGIRVVKAFRMEKREMQEFRESNRKWIDRYMGVVRAKAKTEAATHILTNGGFALLLCGIGVVQLTSGAIKDFGAMAVWLAGFGTMYQHIRRISKGYQTIQESMGAAERLFEVLDIKPGSTVERRGNKQIDHPMRDVEFRNVSFSYDSERVLDDITFKASAGEIIAIVGPSGAGKSTLLDLVGRFYDPESGSICINGIDIRDLDPDHWSHCWALVDQQPFLFHASIRENVAYGKPNATDEEIRSALREANLLDFVDSLPNGILTEVGDRGARLSGGQRQRLTIARALLMNPSILLLDEVTSALDAESERAVREALDRLMSGRTSLVVAHRLSTIRSATRILVLERGKLVEQGTHDELLRLGGVYRKLYEMQFGQSLPDVSAS